MEDFPQDIKTPVGDWVLIRKCAVGDEVDGEFMDGGIVLPDIVWDNSNFVEVISVGPRCKLYKGGEVTWCPESTNSLNNDGCPESYWWIREDELVPLLFEGNRITPLSDIIVIRIGDVDSGEIEISQRTKLRALFGDVLSVGPDARDLACGDEVILPPEGWKFAIGDEQMLCVHASEIVGTVLRGAA